MSSLIHTTTRWSIEQHSPGGLHAKLEELVWVLHGVLHQLLQLALHVLQTSDVGPRHIGHLHYGLAQSRRRWLRHCVLRRKFMSVPKSFINIENAKFTNLSYPEVVHRHGERVENLRVNLVVLKIDEVHLLTDLLKCRLRAQRSQVSADVAVRFCCDLSWRW